MPRKLTKSQTTYVHFKYALALKGYTLTRVAQDLNLWPKSVQDVLQGRYKSKRVSQYVEQIISG